MELHRTSGRSRLGLALALTTMLLWGMLPLALKEVLRSVDGATITWIRFVVAALVLAIVLRVRGKLPSLRSLSRSRLLLLAVATLFLALNYWAYIVALDRTTPADAQVLIQLAPLLLALVSIAFFGESFTRVQWTGFAFLIGGLLLFFSSQLAALAEGADRYLVGNAIMVAAALTWAIYGAAQKQLLRSLSSQGIMVCIYAGSALFFSVVAEPAQLGELDGLGIALLVFCALNTLVGYGAFSEALEHWEASRVSAVLALTPLATLGFQSLVEAAWPELQQAAPLPAASWLGALVVVLGSLTTSLGGRPMAPKSEPSSGGEAAR